MEKDYNHNADPSWECGSPASTEGKKQRKSSSGDQPRRCQVPGCGVVLSGPNAKAYCLQRHICMQHLQAQAIKCPGSPQLMRFCLQCAKLEPLSAFDGLKRTCRIKLRMRRDRRIFTSEATSAPNYDAPVSEGTRGMTAAMSAAVAAAGGSAAGAAAAAAAATTAAATDAGPLTTAVWYQTPPAVTSYQPQIQDRQQQQQQLQQQWWLQHQQQQKQKMQRKDLNRRLLQWYGHTTNTPVAIDERNSMSAEDTQVSFGDIQQPPPAPQQQRWQPAESYQAGFDNYLSAATASTVAAAAAAAAVAAGAAPAAAAPVGMQEAAGVGPQPVTTAQRGCEFEVQLLRIVDEALAAMAPVVYACSSSDSGAHPAVEALGAGISSGSDPTSLAAAAAGADGLHSSSFNGSAAAAARAPAPVLGMLAAAAAGAAAPSQAGKIDPVSVSVMIEKLTSLKQQLAVLMQVAGYAAALGPEQPR